MFTISSPENSHIGSVEVRTLNKAIQTKHVWENDFGLHAIITDLNGYVVSTQEQTTYLTRPLRMG